MIWAVDPKNNKMNTAPKAYPCLIHAWHQHEHELRRWLIARLGNPNDASDLLQDVFEKVMLQGEHVCQVNNMRAWLFQVTRHALIDSLRSQREQIELSDDDVPEDNEESAPIDALSECLPRVLSELSLHDREVITRCDIEGMSQQDFASMKSMGLSAVKSRIQRARTRLRQTLEKNCQVRFDETGQVCFFVPRTRG